MGSNSIGKRFQQQTKLKIPLIDGSTSSIGRSDLVFKTLVVINDFYCICLIINDIIYVFYKDSFNGIHYLTEVGQYHGNTKLASIVMVSSDTTVRGKLTNMSVGGSIRKNCSDSCQMLKHIVFTYKDEVKKEQHLELNYLIRMFSLLKASNAKDVE